MSAFRRPAIAAALLIATMGTVPLALAQPAPGAGAPTHHATIHKRDAEQAKPGRFIEGRLAFLRAELKLTPEQQPLFDKLADEMRASAKAMAEKFEARRQQANATAPAALTALDRLERRQAMMKEAMAAQERYLAAFRPFYQSLSAEQKATADVLFAKGPGGARFGHHKGHHGLRHH